MFFLIWKLDFLMMSSGSNYVKINCFLLRCTIGLFSFLNFCNRIRIEQWDTTQSRRLAKYWRSSRLVAYIISLIFEISILFHLLLFFIGKFPWLFSFVCRRYWNWDGEIRIRLQLSLSKRTTRISASHVSSPSYHYQYVYFTFVIVTVKITHCFDLSTYEFLEQIL